MRIAAKGELPLNTTLAGLSTTRATLRCHAGGAKEGTNFFQGDLHDGGRDADGRRARQVDVDSVSKFVVSLVRGIVRPYWRLHLGIHG